jgi:hypothetical protein
MRAGQCLLIPSIKENKPRAVPKRSEAKKFHLWSTPVAVPFYRTYDVLRQSSAACKAL